MRHPLCTTLVLCSSLGFALPSHAQLAAPAQTTLPAPPANALVLPVARQSTLTYTQTSADGKIATQQTVNIEVNDSQGRSLTANTVLRSGITTNSVDDPVAEMFIAWDSSGKLAKELKYPEPIPGRQSCWKQSHEDIFSPRGEPHIPLAGTGCRAAEERVPRGPSYHCTSQHFYPPLVTELPPIQITTPSCPVVKPPQIVEDLGTKTIHGLEARGCRTTDPSTAQVDETWWIKLSSGKLSSTFAIHSEYSFPKSNNTTSQTIQDLTKLNVNEPDPSTFRPPPNYEIKTIEMHEVPCDELHKPS
jgi:hypothetical protein